jgi:carbamoyltransferase
LARRTARRSTSFNENGLSSAAPAQALDCFLRTKMNVLVLGNHFISRASSA